MTRSPLPLPGIATGIGAMLLLATCLGACQSRDADNVSPEESSLTPNGSRKVKVVFTGASPQVVDSAGRLSNPRPPATMDQPPPPTSKGGLTWDAPKTWKNVPPSSAMRAAQYDIPRAAGDAQDAELAVFYFGPSGAGGIDETFTRWLSSFDPPSAAKARRSSKKIGPIDVQVVEVTGAYDAGNAMAGTTPADAGTARAETTLLGAILTAPDGTYYFKLIGPQKTVAAGRSGFDELIRSCRPSSSPAVSTSLMAPAPSGSVPKR